MIEIGQVDWYGAAKNDNGKKIVSPYGFIKHKEYPEKIFFHKSGMDHFFLPQTDDWVYFYVVKGKGDKKAAANVKKINFYNVFMEENPVFFEIFSKNEVSVLLKKDEVDLDGFIEKIYSIFLDGNFLINDIFLRNSNFLLKLISDTLDFSSDHRLFFVFKKFPQIFEGVSFDRLKSLDDHCYLDHAVQKDVYDFIRYDFSRSEVVECFDKNIAYAFERAKKDGFFESIEDNFIDFLEKSLFRKESFILYFLAKSKKDLLPWVTNKIRAKMLYIFLKSYSFDVKEVFNKHVVCDFDANVYYNSFDQENFNLINSWINFDSGKKEREFPAKDYTHEQVKMISARVAEMAAQDFFKSHGFSVKDIAITQGNTDTKSAYDWTLFDFNASGFDLFLSVDVKNARSAFSSIPDKTKKTGVYSEFCIPDFKKNRYNEDVIICGVYSEYLSKESIFKSVGFKDVKLLGVTNLNMQLKLRDFFCREGQVLESLSFDRGGKEGYLPVWLFSYPAYAFDVDFEIFGKQKIAEIDEVFSLTDFYLLHKSDLSCSKEFLKNTLVEIIFINFFSFKGIEKFLEVAGDLSLLEKYEYDFYKTLSEASIFTQNFGLPVVFLTTLTNILKNVSNKSLDFDFYEGIASRFSGIDTMRALSSLVANLKTIYAGREVHKFTDFKIFKLQGGGLLQGRSTSSGKNKTLLAYCGGFVNPSTKKTITTINERFKAKCGYEPLLITDHESCSGCHKLICPKCLTCMIGCTEMALRIDEVEKKKALEKLKSSNKTEPPENIWDGYE